MKNEEIVVAGSMAVVGILVVLNVFITSLIGDPWRWISIIPWSIIYYFYYKKVIKLWKKL